MIIDTLILFRNADIKAASLSYLPGLLLDSLILAMLLTHVPKCEPARRLYYHLPCSLKMFKNVFVFFT